MEKRGKGRFYNIYVLLFLLLFVTSCALPRIIILEDPLTPEEHINLGVAYEKKGELDNALKEYKEASNKLPSAYLYMGNIYFQKNELDEAERYYKKAIKKIPGTQMRIIIWRGFITQKKKTSMRPKPLL